MNDGRRLIEIERLGQIIERPFAQCRHRRVETAERRDDNDRDRAGDFAKFAHRRQAIHAGQPHVEHNQIGPARGHFFQRLFGRRSDADHVPLVAEQSA